MPHYELKQVFMLIMKNHFAKKKRISLQLVPVYPEKRSFVPLLPHGPFQEPPPSHGEYSYLTII
jgi:hypothetical protein